VAVDKLPSLREDMARRLTLIEDQGDTLARLARQAEQTRADYVRLAQSLSAARRGAALRLDHAVSQELPPLKLERARFLTEVSDLLETDWGPAGIDRVAFKVATNPGSPPGFIGKIASGGELARFMLALKVVLARSGTVPSLIFDEVDTGIGGAVAAAVGQRLARLGREVQVLVVTHSPQVAARGAHHFKVRKTNAGERVVTDVVVLNEEERREEIARMLSGDRITNQARAAADALLTAGGGASS
jgi:DNA repair protein RecN (Recombination protein N)